MSTRPTQPAGRPGTRPPVPLALAFPRPGPALRNAYRELDLALNGTDADRKALGDLGALPRPWDPATLTTPQLREEHWEWVEAVADWVNTEYVWETSTTIPSCWPMHPHLVHEIGVLADQRHHAGTAFTSDRLEEWHRHALPAFFDRLKQRARTMCEERHQDWPARGRYSRYRAEQDGRHGAYRLDQDTCRAGPDQDGDVPGGAPHLAVIDGNRIDLDTGEVF